MVQCEFLKRKFKINKNVLKQLQSVALISEIEYTEQEAMEGLPQIEIKGYKPQSVSIRYTAVTTAGVNPYTEYSEWKKKLGKAGEFYIGEEQFGVDIFTLERVSMIGAKINAKGEFLIGEIELALTQDIATGA